MQPPPPRRITGIDRFEATVFVLIIAGIVIGAAVFAAHGAFTANQTPVQPDQTTPAENAPSGTWTTTQTFTGNGIRSTAIFSVSSDWKLLYTCANQDNGQVDGVLTVEVYGADNTLQDVALDATCHTAHDTGETEEHQGGSIYLKISGTGDWAVQVQELQ